MKSILFIGLCLLGLIVVSTDVLAQYRHPRHVISGAGGRMSSADVRLEATLTQTAIGYLGGTDSSAHVGFWYPVVLTSEIDTTGVVFQLPHIEAKTGDVIDIPIRQEQSHWLKGRIPTSVILSVSFNGSVLQPLEPRTQCPTSGMCTAEVTVTPSASDGIVGTIRCKVKLGDAEQTPLLITAVQWPPTSRVRTTLIHGDVEIMDICHEGDSTRLIIAGEATRLAPPRPMPATTTIDVAYAVAGRTSLSISLVNASGTEVLGLITQEHEAGRYVVRQDVSAVPVGKYFVVMRTNEGLYMQPLVIVR